ncbi:N-acetylglucosamine-6-phosphate deacetylase [Lachnospiraceae bacterium 47-T17]
MWVQSKRIWIADQFFPASLKIENGKICGVFPYDGHPADADYGDARIVPGFLDVHCHGAYGFDTNDGDAKGLRRWAKGVAAEGVTGFLATTITQSEEVLTGALSNVADVMAEGDACEGAEILGIHLEGPFLNPVCKGAHPQQYIQKPSVEQFEVYQKAARGQIKYITLAPELDDAFALTSYASSHGVVVSVGHSAASYEETVLAYAQGARSVTHVYNGMKPFHHRNNGVVGAAYRIRTMYGEIICDGNHSTRAALNSFFTAKGPDYALMVSDALLAKGSPAGSEFEFGGSRIVTAADGSAHLNGTEVLAGSTLKLNEGLRILVEEALVPFPWALNACTRNPARCIGLGERKGSIRAGYDADLVVLDGDYRVVQTYCRGRAQL